LKSIKKIKNKNKKTLKKYWSLLYPKSYVNKMVAKGFISIFKFAKSEKNKVYFKAKLKKTDEGFHYLDIPNGFIHSLFKLIDADGIEKPPYFEGDRSAGAHISVIDADEGKELKVKEIGHFFNFSLKEFFSVKPEGWKEMDQVYFIEIECPELKKLRKKYKLPETYKDKGHEFHITIACKKKND
jgi:hypothetical protein